ncbi:unnamed protein product [Lupinus luteus]|uniref:Uncharacterized protein n=1 Tax=Lupinus luteus TaxID=3873 RepID=A0AAV1XJT2_LUPLU
MVLVDQSSNVIKKESFTSCEKPKEFLAIQQRIAQDSAWVYCIRSCLEQCSCIAQPASCMTSWFSGTLSEQLLLKEHLDSASGEIFYDAGKDFPGTVFVDDEDDDITCTDILTGISVYFDDTEETNDLLHTLPPSGPNKRRKLMNSVSADVEVNSYLETILSI